MQQTKSNMIKNPKGKQPAAPQKPLQKVPTFEFNDLLEKLDIDMPLKKEAKVSVQVNDLVKDFDMDDFKEFGFLQKSKAAPVKSKTGVAQNKNELQKSKTLEKRPKDTPKKEIKAEPPLIQKPKGILDLNLIDAFEDNNWNGVLRSQSSENILQDLCEKMDQQAEAEVEAENVQKTKKLVNDKFYRRNLEFLEKRQQKLKKLEKEAVGNFKPTINKKSEMLDKKRRNQQAKDSDFRAYESVTDLNQKQQALREEVESERYEKFGKEEEAHCTFQPKLNKYYGNAGLFNSNVADRNAEWDKKRGEKLQEKAVLQNERELDGCTFVPGLQKSFNKK